jgi:hypothetical protein
VIVSCVSTDVLYFTARFALTLFSNSLRSSSALAGTLSCMRLACSESCRLICSALGCCVCRISLRIFRVSICRPKIRVMTSSHSQISFLSFPISSDNGTFPAIFCRRLCLHFVRSWSSRVINSSKSCASSWSNCPACALCSSHRI